MCVDAASAICLKKNRPIISYRAASKHQTIFKSDAAIRIRISNQSGTGMEYLMD